jgi:hypothetical protein
VANNEEPTTTAAAADPPPSPEPPEEQNPPTSHRPPAPVRSRRRLTSIIFLVFGLFVAYYLTQLKPQEQHVRVVLGRGAPEVTALGLQYIGKEGDIAREAHFSFGIGQAPRVVAHEPQLPNGSYRLQIDVDARDGRRAIQRQVTLGGGSTQVDVSDALTTPSQIESRDE